MKSFFAQLILVASIAATAVYAGPAIRADWPAVEELADQLHTLVSASILTIRTVANDDNEAIGASIGEKLDNATIFANEILDAATEEIIDRTLTEDSARSYLQRLEVMLLQLQIDLQEDVNQLSEEAQASIRLTFLDAYTQARLIADEIYAALNRN